MSADAKEVAFQQDIIDQMVEGGWQLGDAADYDRERALYPSDCLAYIKKTQPRVEQSATRRSGRTSTG